MPRTVLILLALALAAPAAAQPPTELRSLSVTVRPTTAAAYSDGGPWVAPALSVPLVVQLAPGRHAIDVRAPGYRPFSTVVEIHRGESTPLNVSLPAGYPPPEFGPPRGPQPGQIRQV